jgi:hypothetical protein
MTAADVVGKLAVESIEFEVLLRFGWARIGSVSIQ